MPNVDTFIVIVTAKLNRAQKAFAALFTKSIGTNIVTKISEAAMTVEATFFTVLTAVPQGDPHFLLNPVRIVLIIMTELLIIALTIRIKVKRASRPTSNFVIQRKVNAFIREIMTFIKGTNAECISRRKIQIMTTIRRTVLTSAPTIPPIEVLRNDPTSTTALSPRLLGKLVWTLLVTPPTLPTTLPVPDLVARTITNAVLGQLDMLLSKPHDAAFNLTLVILPKCKAPLLLVAWIIKLFNLLSALQCF